MYLLHVAEVVPDVFIAESCETRLKLFLSYQ
jgi:hypothetical protein